jgi:hypothetical protein
VKKENLVWLGKFFCFFKRNWPAKFVKNFPPHRQKKKKKEPQQSVLRSSRRGVSTGEGEKERNTEKGRKMMGLGKKI